MWYFYPIWYHPYHPTFFCCPPIHSHDCICVPTDCHCNPGDLNCIGGGSGGGDSNNPVMIILLVIVLIIVAFLIALGIVIGTILFITLVYIILNHRMNILNKSAKVYSSEVVDLDNK